MAEFSVGPLQADIDAALSVLAELILTSWVSLLSPILSEEADAGKLGTWSSDTMEAKKKLLAVSRAVDDSKLLSSGSALAVIVQLNAISGQCRHMFAMLASCSKLVNDAEVGRVRAQ